MALLLVIISIVAARNARKLARRKMLTGPARFRDRLQAMRKLGELPAKEFKRMFRVDRTTFTAVLNKISPRLERRMPNKAHARGSALPVELMLACALRFLAGGSYLDICFGLEMSRAGFYRALDDVVDAINAEYTLCFNPADEAALRDLSNDWQRYKGAYIRGVVGAVDGIAVKIRCPGGEVRNPGAYYNHHQTDDAAAGLVEGIRLGRGGLGRLRRALEIACRDLDQGSQVLVGRLEYAPVLALR
ncbi:hypothetical protein KFE25_003431 [Diacronema lutheri]|uniref:DDE Tnp4 domain-containing protein n=1 Tax=Diacronema lutheri TaxID=2081491 RepID=A0A8J5XHM9_DIALT|nr:hypothetical protein KFE25_003431 [Diacronema lutheri]